MFNRFWNDDDGVVVSSEITLVAGIVLFGIVPGLVALRNSTNAALATAGNALGRVTPTFTFSGYAVTDVNGGNTIASVGGLQLNYATGTQLSAAQVAPIVVPPYTVVSPAP
jgi:Flp pilus assembly pilin Flp